jgi:L,D-peptidoglycan transpeptidase YkuD (ErfK/YbiS/YcfS/YnhG family)
MPLKKLLGLTVMAVGIGWYSWIKMAEQAAPTSAVLSSSVKFPERSINGNGTRGIAARVPLLQVRAASSSTDAEDSVMEGQSDVGKHGVSGRNWSGQNVSPRRAKQFDQPLG